MSELLKQRLLKTRRIILYIIFVILLVLAYAQSFIGILGIITGFILGAIYSGICVLLDDSLKDTLEV